MASQHASRLQPVQSVFTSGGRTGGESGRGHHAGQIVCMDVQVKDAGEVSEHLRLWRRAGATTADRLRAIVASALADVSGPEARISTLASNLQITRLQDLLGNVFTNLNVRANILVDRLDEGYEPDAIGVGLASGLVHAVLDINTRLERTRATVFVRDNIARAIARLDPDYSRDMEGQVLRLHWDEALLFQLVCSRLRSAFQLQPESDLKVWDRCTGSNLHGHEGFRQVLRLTLYRPRDVLSLLNQAFYRAAGVGRGEIVLEDLESTATEISNNRLNDLVKEYREIIPGLAGR